MLDVTYTLLDDMRTTNHCTLSDAAGRSQTQCTALNKLRLERYLTMHGVLPAIQHATEIKIAVVELMQCLRDATMVNIADTQPTPHETHGISNVQLLYALSYDELHHECSVTDRLGEKIDQVIANRVYVADEEMMDDIRWNACALIP